MTDTSAMRLIGIAVPTLRELRAATLASVTAAPADEAGAVDVLREAGFAGGPAIYEAFEQWLAEGNGSRNAAELTIDEFGERTARYFRDAGWGRVTFDAEQEESVATISMGDCWEADHSAGLSSPSCHITTGMLASFFGKLAGYPVSVMETECRSAGGDQCRFLLGNSEIMAYRWEELR